MCGIAGVFSWQGGTSQTDLATVIGEMTEALRHRGPDGSGTTVWTAGDLAVALGHRRLAILDLSDRAAQPMTNVRGSVSITFNGEIYNFRSLRRDLERKGHAFRSDSDTEAILVGYEEWGEGVVDRLEGMFAFGLIDGDRRRLLLARDRLGIKPLYLHRGPGRLLFASEVRALLASRLVPRRLDVPALDHFLAFQTVATPRTLVEGVELLPPGHVLAVDDAGRATIRCYWDLLGNSPPQAGLTPIETARAEVRARLRQSVAGHLLSDVPIGVFLSGGVDSTAIVALARETGLTPETYSVVLPGSSHDESAFARLVADRFGCHHHEIVLTEEDLAWRVPEALAVVDHPTGDGINSYIVSRAVREAGIKVALSGLGGDELFGGYPSFSRLRRMKTYALAWRRAPTALRTVAASAVRHFGSSVATDKAAAVLEGDGSWSQAFPVMRQVFGRAEREALLGPPGPAAAAFTLTYARLLADAASSHQNRELMSFISYAEARTYMHDVLLRDTDQMSMAHGLEVRVPLLDRALVEYVLGLPDRLKDPGGPPKSLLVDSLEGALPEAAVGRPKRGFVLPFDTWMKGGLRGLCEEHLGPNGLGRYDVIRQEAVQRVWRQFLAGDARTTWSRPWTLVALGAWLSRNAITA